MSHSQSRTFGNVWRDFGVATLGVYAPRVSDGWGRAAADPPIVHSTTNTQQCRRSAGQRLGTPGEKRAEVRGGVLRRSCEVVRPSCRSTSFWHVASASRFCASSSGSLPYRGGGGCPRCGEAGLRPLQQREEPGV